MIKRTLYYAVLAFFAQLAVAQKVTWDDQYLIQLEDFQNAGTEINDQLASYSLSAGTYMEFAMKKNAYAFAFSRGFNEYTSAIFNKSSAMLIAPDSMIADQLLMFARYSFDLTELYTRRFRQRMYEEKGPFSKVDFYQPIFEEINNELGTEHARVLKLTDLGREESILRAEHQKVREQIIELSDFCKGCKLPKKRKK